VDPFQLTQAQLVDLVGGQVGGGVMAQGIVIVGASVRELPGAAAGRR